MIQGTLYPENQWKMDTFEIDKQIELPPSLKIKLGWAPSLHIEVANVSVICSKQVVIQAIMVLISIFHSPNGME